VLKQAGLTKGTDGVYAKGGKKLSLLAQTTTELTVSTRCRLSSNSTSRWYQLKYAAFEPRDFFNTVLPHRTFEIGLFAWGQSSILEPGGTTLYMSRYIHLSPTVIRDRTTVVSVTLKQTPS